MKHKILTFLFLAISMTCAAQNERVVKGIVRSEKGTPVSGAVVSAHEAELSVRTGSDGAFVITLPDNVEKLQAACSGYHTIVLAVDGSFMEFRLRHDKGYASKAFEYASIEAQMAKDAEKRILDEEAARLKEEKHARSKALDQAYNERFRNAGFVHSVELAYGYQLSHGDVVYRNLGYREYGNLQPVEFNYTFGYRFNSFFSLGIGAGVQYQMVNLCTYGDVFEPLYTDHEDFTPVNVPIYINTKVYLTRTRVQPLVALSGGVYLPNSEAMFDLGFGADLRLSRRTSMYVLVSFRTTPYGDFREYSGQEGIASRPAFYMYYPKCAWTPSVKIGLTL